jgi:hypothetical protein
VVCVIWIVHFVSPLHLKNQSDKVNKKTRSSSSLLGRTKSALVHQLDFRGTTFIRCYLAATTSVSSGRPIKGAIHSIAR